MTMLPPAFLLRYQQPVACCNAPAVSDGTRTKTAARESSDQDMSTDWIVAATRTFTEAREQADQDADRLALATQTHSLAREQIDQDPWHTIALGTRTQTDSREASDNDPSRAGWAILPRA